jgi:hypothetical protein
MVKQMRTIFYISITFSLMICIFVILLTQIPMKKDCNLAEISPDFNVHEKQQCRKLSYRFSKGFNFSNSFNHPLPKVSNVFKER